MGIFRMLQLVLKYSHKRIPYIINRACGNFWTFANHSEPAARPTDHKPACGGGFWAAIRPCAAVLCAGLLLVLGGCGVDEDSPPEQTQVYDIEVPAEPIVVVEPEYPQTRLFGPYAPPPDLTVEPLPILPAPFKPDVEFDKIPAPIAIPAHMDEIPYEQPEHEPPPMVFQSAPEPASQLIDLRIRRPESGGIVVMPGEVLSLGLTVSAAGEGEHEILENLQLPSGWTSLFAPAVFMIDGGGHRQRILAVSVPVGTLGGVYIVTYRAQPAGRMDLATEIRLQVNVGARPALAVMVDEHPEFVVAGDPFTSTVRLLNKGNITICVATSASSSDKFQVWPWTVENTIEPGDGVEVTFRVDTPAGLMRSVPHRLRLASRLVGEHVSDEETITSLLTEVLPRSGVEPNPWVLLPARLTLAAMTEEGHRSWLASLDGSGYLDEAGHHRLDILLRGKDNRQQGVFGRQDEYRARYTSDLMKLSVGDHYFNLSRLSSNYFYGRGVSLSLFAGRDTDLGAHYAQSRWISSEHQWSAFARRRLTPWATVKLNLLYRTTQHLLPANDRIVSLETTLDNRRGEKLHLETAYGSRTSSAESNGGALRLLFSSDRGGRTLSFERITADVGYNGYFHDHEQTSGRMRLHHGRLFETYVAAQQYASPTFGVTRSGSRHGGLNWRPGGGASSLFLEARHSYLDLSSGYSDSGYDETSFRVGYGRNYPRVRFNVYLEAGEQWRNAAAAPYRILRLSSFAHFSLARNSTLFLQGQMSDRDDVGGGLLGSGSYLSGSLNWRHDTGHRLSLRASANNLNSRVRKQNTQLDAACTWALSRDLSLDMRLRHSRWNGDQSRNAFLLSVTRGFGMPVGRKSSVGAVRGVVFDLEDPQRRGLPGVIVRLNSLTAVTDESGAFAFPAVEPGTMLLTVDSGTLGLNMITQMPLPLMIDVRGGDTERLEIGVARTARVEGRVSLFVSDPVGAATATDAQPGGTLYIEGSDPRSVIVQPAEKRRFVPESGLADILVEISNGETVHRKFTGASGHFEFPELTHGIWTLTVSTWNLPPHYELETHVVEIDVAAGETVEVPLRVLPSLRGIEIIDSGDLGLATLE